MAMYRQRRICFRLTFEEEQRYLPLLKNDWETTTWSRLIRKCLLAYWKSKDTSKPNASLQWGAIVRQQLESDQGPAPIAGSSATSPAKRQTPDRASDKKKRSRRPSKAAAK